MELTDTEAQKIFQEAVNKYLDNHGLMGFIRNVIRNEIQKRK